VPAPRRIPEGYTGRDSTDPSHTDIMAWAEEHPDGDVALRLSDDLASVDVDAYGTKTGAATLAEAEKRWGKLPPTFRTTSRRDGSVTGRFGFVIKVIEDASVNYGV
jgi:Bifunctional DNA primase/polymerase, N-terminal